MQERTAGGGQPDAGYLFHTAAAQALVDGVVFAVDGEQGLTLLFGLGGDQLAGDYQTFFVGKADGFSGADRFVGRLEAGDADDGADYEIHFGMGCDLNCAGCAVDDFDFGDAGGAEPGAECGGMLLVGQRKDARLPAHGLLEGEFGIVAGG